MKFPRPTQPKMKVVINGAGAAGTAIARLLRCVGHSPKVCVPVNDVVVCDSSGGNIPSRVREAMRLTQEEKPGAVHLELPEDIAAEQVDEEPIPASHVRRPIAEEKSIRAAVEMIRAAKSPLLLVGAGANRKRTCNMLRKCVAKFGIPFATTQMGKALSWVNLLF